MEALPRLLDYIADLARDGSTDPVREELDPGESRAAVALIGLLRDRSLRPEHRRAIYAHLVESRDLLADTDDPRVVDLVYWAEQVGRLHTAFKKRSIGEFHYTRALEATVRRCGFDLLPAMGRLDELGAAWSSGDFARTRRMLSADLVESDPSDETAGQLGP